MEIQPKINGRKSMTVLGFLNPTVHLDGREDIRDIIKDFMKSDEDFYVFPCTYTIQQRFIV